MISYFYRKYTYISNMINLQQTEYSEEELHLDYRWGLQNIF